MWKHYRFDPSDVIFQKTPYTFDVSVWELFITIGYGSSQVACTKEVIYDPYALAVQSFSFCKFFIPHHKYDVMMYRLCN